MPPARSKVKAGMNTPTTSIEPSSGFVQFVLDQLNVARLRALLAVNEIETTITALSGGIISAEAALGCLDEFGLLDFVTGASS
jgi:hypothetical protein